VRSLGTVLPLHGFGVKTDGLARYGRWLEPADSLAWSLDGRHAPGCAPSHKTEANCMRHALAWRARVVEALSAAPRGEQPALFHHAARPIAEAV
jgi:hypothetical protein